MMDFSTMRKTFWWLVHSNPAFYIIFIGLAALYTSSIVFFFSYFERLSVQILLAGAATIVLGAGLAAIHGMTQDETDFKREFRTKQ